MVDVLPFEKHHTYDRADEIIPLFDAWINALGIHNAFQIVGTTLLYSGPSEAIYKKFWTAHLRNHTRVEEIIETLRKEKEHTLLDRTNIGDRVGKYINGEKNLYKHLKEIYIKKYELIFLNALNTDQIEEAKKFGSIEADKVMEHVSRTFIENIEGDVETCVCGADLNRVFYQVEMEALIANDKVTTINGVPRETLKDILKSGDPDAKYKTFTAICEAELKMIYARATDPSNKHQKFWAEDYEARKAFFEMEQEETALSRAKIPAAAIVPPRPATPIGAPASKKVAGLH